MEDTDLTNGEQASERREFLKQCVTLAGAGIAGCVVVEGAGGSAYAADIVAADDARLVTQRIKYPIEKGTMDAYLARPKGDGKYPAVIVIQEIFGLNPHIEDVARRVALEGFVAIAPDALTPVGGTAAFGSNEIMQAMFKLDQADTIKNFTAAVQYLKTHPQSTGKVGCTGFCWGGGMTNQVAVHSPDLNAAVPYYGTVPEDADVPKIKAPMLCHFAGDDARINAGIPGFEAALKKAGIEYQIFTYPGASHGFNNDSAPERYHKEAAEQAWKRTIDFFKKKLG
ncbi:MAG: dienelactone hydrolase family protein [Acidobacteriota bacterium]|jgi:carboxymethylenebutenolidase|nr:dienelactone hydrolase family protein [Acidobacteriota bacterium]